MHWTRGIYVWLIGFKSGTFKLRFMVKLKYLTLGSLRFSPINETMNINFPLGEVRNVEGWGSSSYWMVVRDVIISLFSVDVPIFKNRKQKMAIITIETSPPVKERYLAYPSYLMSSLVVKKSIAFSISLIFLRNFIFNR